MNPLLIFSFSLSTSKISYDNACIVFLVPSNTRQITNYELVCMENGMCFGDMRVSVAPLGHISERHFQQTKIN